MTTPEAERARYRRAFQRMQEMAQTRQESAVLLCRHGKYLIRFESDLRPGEVDEVVAGVNP